MVNTGRVSSVAGVGTEKSFSLTQQSAHRASTASGLYAFGRSWGIGGPDSRITTTRFAPAFSLAGAEVVRRVVSFDLKVEAKRGQTVAGVLRIEGKMLHPGAGRAGVPGGQRNEGLGIPEPRSMSRLLAAGSLVAKAVTSNLSRFADSKVMNRLKSHFFAASSRNLAVSAFLYSPHSISSFFASRRAACCCSSSFIPEKSTATI